MLDCKILNPEYRCRLLRCENRFGEFGYLFFFLCPELQYLFYAVECKQICHFAVVEFCFAEVYRFCIWQRLGSNVQVTFLPMNWQRQSRDCYGNPRTMSDVSRQSSPKSSPRGSRSPAYPRQDSTGTLKTTITLGKKPSVFQGGTFYLMKEPPGIMWYAYEMFWE